MSAIRFLRQQAEEALHQANSKLNLLSGIIRHDILNGVAFLPGYIELANEEKISQAAKQYLSKLNEAMKTIQHLIEFTREYPEIGVKFAA